MLVNEYGQYLFKQKPNRREKGTYKRVCSFCKKKFETSNSSRLNCSAKCSFGYTRDKAAKKREAKYAFSEEKICLHCKIPFEAFGTLRYCSKVCMENKKNQDYIKKWASGIIDEPKRAKMARKNQIKLDWHRTEITDPINRKLKVMRG